MNAQEHYDTAQYYLDLAEEANAQEMSEYREDLLRRAQIHATLAITAGQLARTRMDR